MQSLPFTSFQTPTKKPFPPHYSPHNDSPPHHQKHSLPKSEFTQRDYGKAKGIEILTFKDSELERTYASQTSFIAAGALHVIYFEAYNRFIISINDWRYVLLRRMPVVGSDTRLPGPVTYTLPTCDGFYTLRLISVDNMASVKNFETILANSSKFSSKESVNNSSRRISGEYVQNLSEFENAETTPLTRSDRWKRGFRKLNSRISNSFKRRDKPNLNLYQVRDFESLKRTNEIMAPLHFIPKREIDSLISMYKDVANKYGFQPETHSSGLQNCPLTPIAESKINQTAFSNPFASPSPTRGGRQVGITASPQPEKAGSIGNMAQSHAINPKNYGASQPRLMDRIKAKIPGEHHYYGEKQAGEKIMTHSHTLREQRRTSQPRRTIKEVVERNLMKDNNNEGSLLDSFATEQDPYEIALSPKFAEHEDTLEIARKTSLELVEKYTKDYLAHKEKMSRFSTQSKMSGAEAQNSFGVDLETVDTPRDDKESGEVMLDSRSVGRREAKGLRKRVALKIDYENEENVLNLDSILRSEGLEQCEG